MTILSDRQIRDLCMPPTCRVAYGNSSDWQLSNLSQQEIDKRNEGKKPGDFNFLAVKQQISIDPVLSAAKRDFKPMIEPFEPWQVREVARGVDRSIRSQEERQRYITSGFHVEKVISYGLSSFGYDVRCSHEFKVFTNVNSTVIDPKDFSADHYVDVDASERGYVIIPPNSFALSRTLEYFRIPRDVLVVCLGKSTYARTGIVVNVTPLEPEWEGHVTLEFSNTTPLPAKLYANEGCAQMLFFRGDEPCEVSYADRGGKYQGQTGITIPKA